jgi:short-subunit dehydrogenase
VNKLGDHYRTALVTGASAGLGRAVAEMLLDEGVGVWGTARDPARLPVRAGLTPVALDLDADASVDAAFQKADCDAGGFDLAVNNAGYGLYGPFVARDFDDWRRQLDAMLGRTLRLSHLVLRGMLARNRGAMVNVSSLAVDFPLPFMSGYNVVKAGLAAFSESLMVEVAGTGVIVIDFRPGDYRTNFNQTMQANSGIHFPHEALPADRPRRAWAMIEKNIETAPLPARAAADLRRALRRHRSCTVRSGSLFQAWFAPLLARMVPLCLRRAATARYFGCS